jgi:RNA polymerase sigma factor (TIGR02999 family)
MGDISLLISRAREGDDVASKQLFTELYTQLRSIAANQLRRMHSPAGHTTSLVHDVYFRLSKPASLHVRDRSHFYALAGKAMRQVLIDQVRERACSKRSDAFNVPLQEVATFDAEVAPPTDESVEALEQAMLHLGEIDAALAQLVELRFYAGLTLPEIVELTDRSERSLKRDWRKARAFLHSRLSSAMAWPQ